MAYAPAIIPLKGWHTDFAYSGIPQGHTHDILNMFPADTYRRRVRLGTRPGFNRILDTTTAVQCLVRGIAYSGTSPPILKDRILFVSDGKIWFMDIGSTTATQITRLSDNSTTAALDTTADVEAVQRGKYVYFVDGLAYRRVDLSLNPPKWEAWTGPNATVTNTIGSTAYKATLIALYGSRLVMAGVKGIENIWFMSDVVNPDDWTPSTTIGDAIAGNTGTIGSPGDEIVALIPFGQTGIIFAGQRTLTYLTSDPATDDRAALVQMSRNIGIVGSRAWSNGPEKSIYLMAQEGLYRIAPNDFNVDRGSLVSLNRLDSFFNQVRWENLKTVLFYDIERRGLMCWMNDILLPSNSTHLFYSDQTDGFFPFKMYDPDFRGARSAAQFVTSDGRNQVALYGSEQGMLGFFDQKITCGIDGYAAAGYPDTLNPANPAVAATQRLDIRVLMGPIVNAQPGLMMVRETQIELGSDVYTPNTSVKGDAALPAVTLRTADTAQLAIGTTINTVQVVAVADVVHDGGSASTSVFAVTWDSGGNGASFTDYQSGEFAKSVVDVYTVQETFIAETDRVYRDSINRYEIVRAWDDGTGKLRWVIRFVNAPDVAQVVYLQGTVDGQANVTDPTLDDYDHVVTDDDATVLDTDTDSRVRVTQEGFSDAVVTDLGQIEEGINNRLRCRVRGNAAFLRITSTGYPFAMERVGIDVIPLGPRRGVVDPT